jgi:hypothetical protein
MKLGKPALRPARHNMVVPNRSRSSRGVADTAPKPQRRFLPGKPAANIKGRQGEAILLDLSGFDAYIEKCDRVLSGGCEGFAFGDSGRLEEAVSSPEVQLAD